MKDLVMLRREDREAARLRIELEQHARNQESERRASIAAAAYRDRKHPPPDRSLHEAQ